MGRWASRPPPSKPVYTPHLYLGHVPYTTAPVRPPCFTRLTYAGTRLRLKAARGQAVMDYLAPEFAHTHSCLPPPPPPPLSFAGDNPAKHYLSFYKSIRSSAHVDVNSLSQDCQYSLMLGLYL